MSAGNKTCRKINRVLPDTYSYLCPIHTTLAQH
jgi:hypothetical protein